MGKNRTTHHAEVVELAYTYALGAYAFGLVGSTPTFGTFGPLAQHGRAPVLQSGGRWFKSSKVHLEFLALLSI